MIIFINSNPKTKRSTYIGLTLSYWNILVRTQKMPNPIEIVGTSVIFDLFQHISKLFVRKEQSLIGQTFIHTHYCANSYSHPQSNLHSHPHSNQHRHTYSLQNSSHTHTRTRSYSHPHSHSHLHSHSNSHPYSGVARVSAARGGPQICRPSRFCLIPQYFFDDLFLDPLYRLPTPLF